MSAQTIVASAPAKVILLGGKGVNYGFPALVAAIELRTRCALTPQPGTGYRFAYGERVEAGDRESLAAFRARVEALREAKAHEEIATLAREDFFAPVRYVLAHVLARVEVPGFACTWESAIPVGSGLGSGAAAAASLVRAVLAAAGVELRARELAWLAWQGDVIAHGGLGTGLDTGGSTVGGVVRYSLSEGPSPVPVRGPLPIVVGDTLLRASTATSNLASRNWIAEHPMRSHIFAEMGILVELAIEAIQAGDLERLGHLMNLNQLLKEKLGMNVPRTEALIEASLGAGALGAKISGKGFGGIMVALCPPGKREAVAAAIEGAGGKAIVAELAREGARLEPPVAAATSHSRSTHP